MVKLYVETDSNNNVLNISTVQQGYTYQEAILESDTLDFTKLSGYYLEFDGSTYKLTFNETKYESTLAEQKKEEAEEAGKELFERLKTETILNSASDSDAYTMRYLYEQWASGVAYKKGDRRLYGDNLYKCKQDHTSQDDWTPDKTASLWDLVGAEDAGTKENPVIIPDNFSMMEYVKGKYYKEGDTVYLMNRQGMADGETVSLAYKPSALVGQYFEVVK